MRKHVIANKAATLYLGDCLDVLATLPDSSVDSIVTDPPYELGFLGKSWDASGIAYNAEMWGECLRVLKPGGHLLAFSGSRTYHRMVVAIEDAGFQIRDQIMWVYGSGFPKSHNLKGEWQGWGTALKPAHEPVCVARKPLVGTVADNVLQFGTGAINVDGCRVATADNRARMNNARRSGSSYVVQKKTGFVDPGGNGRWPANLIHDGSEEVVAMFPQTASGSGQVKVSAGGLNRTVSSTFTLGRKENVGVRDFGDFGSAARFFYCAKASKADRDDGNAHPTVKPTALMRYLCRLVTQPGGIVLDPFMGSGSTGKAAMLEGFRFIGIDMTPEYLAIAKARIAAAGKPGRLKLAA